MKLEPEASGSQAAAAAPKEHDYIGLSEHKNPAAGKNSSGNKVSAGLNMRRTELQLGLPGSPQDDEQELQGRPERGNGFHKAGGEHHGDKEEQGANGSSAKSKPAQPQQPARFAPSMTPDAQAWHPQQQQQQQQQQQRSSSSSSSCHIKAPDLHECVEKHVVEDASQSRAPVGWPPVQSFRKNSLASPTVHHAKTVDSLSNPSSPAAAAAAVSTPGASSQHHAPGSQLVKVYMDGVPIGRKVNLRTHSSYDRLSGALEEMFRRFISGQSGAGKAVVKDKLVSDAKKFNFIYGSDYVLTYEDKDGDLMLVGDVPWEMFVGAVKRLRIMKGSEAIGLAPRAAEDQLTAANK